MKKELRKKIENEVSRETHQSLQEIVLDVVSGNGEGKKVEKHSWL